VRGKAATRLRLIVRRLQWPGHVQLGLFDPPQDRAHAIAEVKREVNARVGRFGDRHRKGVLPHF
jgi:hypothetical protein